MTTKTFAKPKMMRFRYGRGWMKAKVSGTYTRKIKGKTHLSHKVRVLGAKRWSAPKRPSGYHTLGNRITNFENPSTEEIIADGWKPVYDKNGFIVDWK